MTLPAIVPPTTAVGLNAQEAAARLAAEGANVLPRPETRTLVRIVAETLRELMFALPLSTARQQGLERQVKQPVRFRRIRVLALVATNVSSPSRYRTLSLDEGNYSKCPKAVI